MKPKNQICKCGHEENNHVDHRFKKKVVTICGLCACKKFEAQDTSWSGIVDKEPKNHSPEGKIVSIDNSSDTYTGLSKNSGTLNDKIPDIDKQWLLTRDVKEFIKDLNELPMEVMEAHQIKDYIKKRAGEDLI